MRNPPSFKFVLILTSLVLSMSASSAMAAQQCFSQAGTYGTLTVAASGAGCGTQLSFGGITGVWMGDGNTTESCQFDISPAVDGSTVEVLMTAHSVSYPNFSEEAVFSMNGSFVAVTNSDIDNSFPAGGVGLLAGTGGLGDPTLGGVSSAGNDGRGTVSFGGAPISVTSINIQHNPVVGTPNGTIYQVCVDDEGDVVEPTTSAKFIVTRDFTDSSDLDVEVTINCNAGNPLQQSFTLSDSGGSAPDFSQVTFTVNNIQDGATTCTITQEPVSGYEQEYDNGTTLSEQSCSYTNVAYGQESTCDITNSPAEFTYEVTKEWEDPEDVLEQGANAEVDVMCENVWDGSSLGTYYDTFTFYASDGEDTQDFTPGSPNPDTSADAEVTSCVAEEVYISSDSVGSDQGCASPTVFTWGGDYSQGCTITNTVVYEGIPTLSQLSMAIMAILMLGFGFFGIRRFV